MDVLLDFTRLLLGDSHKIWFFSIYFFCFASLHWVHTLSLSPFQFNFFLFFVLFCSVLSSLCDNTAELFSIVNIAFMYTLYLLYYYFFFANVWMECEWLVRAAATAPAAIRQLTRIVSVTICTQRILVRSRIAILLLLLYSYIRAIEPSPPPLTQLLVGALRYKRTLGSFESPVSKTMRAPTTNGCVIAAKLWKSYWSAACLSATAFY